MAADRIGSRSRPARRLPAVPAAATSVLVGGSVRTLDPERPLGAALVLSGERIAAVLDDPVDAPAGARRVDLAGGCVVPGLVDAHVHFPSWALARRELRLFGCASLAEALQRVRRAAGGVPPGGWLRGRGWRDELWSDKPTPQALDAVAPGVRVALRAPRRPLAVGELGGARRGR